MGENEIYEAFGITPETNDNTTTGEGADKAAVDADGGASSTTDDGTDTSAADNEESPIGEGNDSAGETEGTVNDSVQTPEENAKFAAIRRQAEAERDRAIAEERAKSDAYVKNAIASLGIVSPYTGKPVTTPEEYEAYKNARAEDFKKNFKERNGLDDAGYDEFVGQLPEVVAAREAKARADAAQKEAARSSVDAEIEIISKLDPDITNLESLFKTESYPEVFKRVKSGMSLSEAYKLVNYDKLQQKAIAAEKQRTLNNQAGKTHMTPTNKAHGQALTPVPDAEKEMYRLFNPDMSDEDIARDYNKRLKAINKSK